MLNPLDQLGGPPGGGGGANNPNSTTGNDAGDQQNNANPGANTAGGQQDLMALLQANPGLLNNANANANPNMANSNNFAAPAGGAQNPMNLFQGFQGLQGMGGGPGGGGFANLIGGSRPPDSPKLPAASPNPNPDVANPVQYRQNAVNGREFKSDVDVANRVQYRQNAVNGGGYVILGIYVSDSLHFEEKFRGEYCVKNCILRKKSYLPILSSQYYPQQPPPRS
jgi:hypothetical protein